MSSNNKRGTTDRAVSETQEHRNNLKRAIVHLLSDRKGKPVRTKEIYEHLLYECGTNLSRQSLNDLLACLERARATERVRKGYHKLAPQGVAFLEDSLRDKTAPNIWNDHPVKDPFPRPRRLSRSLGMRIGYFSTPNAQVTA